MYIIQCIKKYARAVFILYFVYYRRHQCFEIFLPGRGPRIMTKARTQRAQPCAGIVGSFPKHTSPEAANIEEFLRAYKEGEGWF